MDDYDRLSLVPIFLLVLTGKCYKSLRTELGGGFKYFLCSSLFGEMIQFD